MSKHVMRTAGGAVTGFRHNIMIVTTPEVHGRQIRSMLGMVRGNTIRARNIGRDIAAVFRSIVGGEIKEYTKLMGESREQAIDRMVEQAASQGANAVVNVRFTTSMLMGGAAELLAYGTAVVLSE